MRVAERAPAKVNLVLHVGAPGAGGLHPLRSLFASLELGDRVLVEAAAEDVVVCAGVTGENLAGRALAAFRAALPAAGPGTAKLPPLRVSIDKAIPVAAGLGGGSSDAAAVLRTANVFAGRPFDARALRRVAATLGSDVPSQVEPRAALVGGTGEVVEPIGLPGLSLVLLPQEPGLSTAAVYRELDRLRAAGELPRREILEAEPLRRLAAASVQRLAAGLENDLEGAALALRPELRRGLAALHEAGALGARISGSGPTAFGVFSDLEAARRAARDIPGAIVTATR